MLFILIIVTLVLSMEVSVPNWEYVHRTMCIPPDFFDVFLHCHEFRREGTKFWNHC